MKSPQTTHPTVHQTNTTPTLTHLWAISVLICAVVLITIGCQSDQVDLSQTADEVSDGQILTYLEESGYHLDHIHIDGEYIVYEDVVFTKEDVITDMTTPYQYQPDEDLEGLVETRQRGVSANNALNDSICQHGIRLHIASSILTDCGPNVYRAINEAVDALNAVPNLSLRIHLTDDRSDATVIIASDLDLTVFTEQSPFYQIPSYSALAYLSFLGQPGPRIAVDPTWEAISYLTIKSAMMHELLHTVGMHHTGTFGGKHVHHTTHKDEMSIMTPYAQSTGKLSYLDKKALRMYYGEMLYKPRNLSLRRDNNAVTINYTNPQNVTAPYYWVRVYRYDQHGRYQAYQDFPSNARRYDGVGTLTWQGQPDGKYKYRVKGMRYKQDVKSVISEAVWGL